MRRWLLTLGLVVGAFCVGHSSPAFALAPAGDALIVDASGQVLRSGATATEFTLRLPDGAECQGDSQDGGYRVQSFFVSPAFDPGSLTYGYDAPDGKGNQPLWDVFTNPYMQGLTGVAKQKGGPGAIANTPMFSFAVYTPRLDLIPSGIYRVGLACTLHKKTTRFWSTDVRVVIDAAREVDDQITWRVLRATASAPSKRSPLVLAIPALAAVAGVAGLRARARRSS